MKENYGKIFISVEDQITNLKERGLIFNDIDFAKNILYNISYYRLRGYTYPFQDNNDTNHKFKEDITFEEIIYNYNFDTELKILVFKYIEKLEISLRAKIVYFFAERYGSHWYLDKSLYKEIKIKEDKNIKFESSLFKIENDIKKDIKRSKEIFIKSYFTKYENPEFPPSWMSLEVISIGTLSKIYENLNDISIKNNISKEFGLTKHQDLEKIFKSICFVRNICAHHSRLYNRKIPEISLIKEQNLVNKNFDFKFNIYKYPNKLSIILFYMSYMLDIIYPKNKFKEEFKKLLEYNKSKHILE